MGFWNYVRTGDLVPAAAAQDWKALGFNMAMSTEYDCGVNRKEEMLAELDAAEAQGIREILCDRRTRWQTLREQGEAAFRRGVAAVRDDFCSHAAVFGLHIGDEPNKDDFAVAVDAARIVKEMIPGKAAFINFYPADNGYWFTDLMGTDASGYDRKLKSAVTQAGLPVLCYDCYTQCFAYDKESGLHRYFANLNLFRRVAEQTGVPLWTSLLSVGHWKYRVPTEDDFRWQISTAAAHGCKGILWFFVYERLLESSYRNSPIDQWGENADIRCAVPAEPHFHETLRGQIRRRRPDSRRTLRRLLRRHAGILFGRAGGIGFGRYLCAARRVPFPHADRKGARRRQCVAGVARVGDRAPGPCRRRQRQDGAFLAGAGAAALDRSAGRGQNVRRQHPARGAALTGHNAEV